MEVSAQDVSRSEGNVPTYISYIHVYSLYIYLFVYIYIYIYIDLFLLIHSCIQNMCVYIYIYIYTHTYIHTYTHMVLISIYIYIYTHNGTSSLCLCYGLFSLCVCIACSYVYLLYRCVCCCLFNGTSSLIAVSSHKFDSQNFKSRVSNPISRYIESCVNHCKSNMILRKCMHARIQNPRVWKTIQTYPIIPQKRLQTKGRDSKPKKRLRQIAPATTFLTVFSCRSQTRYYICYRPVFSESLLGFGVSSGELLNLAYHYYYHWLELYWYGVV